MPVEAQAPREAQLQAHTEALLRADPLRMACLWAARELALPDWALGAGFVRNLIWDHLHQKAEPTPLNDIDLIYLDPSDPEGADEREYEAWLRIRLPDQRWEVRNQARMHVRQQVPPFASSLATCLQTRDFNANHDSALDLHYQTLGLKDIDLGFELAPAMS